MKFKAFGKDFEEVLENSVLAVSKVLDRGKKIKSAIKKKIKIKGKDNEGLLYNLIEEMIYLFDAKNFVVIKSKIKVGKNGKEISAEFYGDDVKKYKLTNYIKAVTYNEMFVKKIGEKWVAQVVLDI
jgi:SHS2 domain-containing protein